MQVSPLSIEGVWAFTPLQHRDDRGVFMEAFKASTLSATIGHRFTLEQANISMSKAGTVRGIHFAQVPPGQAKYVQCVAGAILDVVVDIRVGSPTFGQWDAIELDADSRKALYVAEGLGHAFCALTEDATVSYLCSQPYAPGREFGVHPLDPELGLPWPDGEASLLSPKDAAAPTLAQAQAAGLLPDYAECRRYLATL